ncbi:MAG: hypothetical protein XU11_C0004G0041 [Candidatus Dadabacteria bacterium CSP1-2]|nr:MAG: hypothetical protein XU11_C0004G0041 [Candidatus Dadabacteria bacterium CSP1-2]MBF8303611.1 hypothetical protein [Candidatus Dadabacteria bacterium]
MWRDDAYLLDILIAARRAREFTSDLTWEDFQKSSLHQNAVMRMLEIIGEAARKISQETKNAHPDIPWKDITGMRNRLIHEYFRIDIEKVWDTVRNDIPVLITIIEPLVPPEEET